MAINLNDIKREISKSGASKGKILYFKEGTKIRVRFLTDFEDGVSIPFHDSFQLGINVPCQELFGRDCEYCENEDLRTRNQYAWSVYDYDAKEVKILMQPVNQCSPVSALAALYESYGTLLDRDYEIKQIGNGQGKTFSVIPLEKMRFRNTKVKALAEKVILKYIDKAYPADNNELDDEEEDEAPKTRKQQKAKKRPPMNEPEPEEGNEDDWDDEEGEDEEQDYESMSPQELYKLCKERGISCKPKKTKEYYIDMLEEQDEEQEDEDDWDEE